MSIKLVTDDFSEEPPEPVCLSIMASQIQDAIKSVEFHLFRGTSHMVCCATLSNGFTVIGESACADPKKFDLNLGQKYAREDVENKIAGFLAYGQAEKIMFGGKYEH
jgi:hypothetical protein